MTQGGRQATIPEIRKCWVNMGNTEWGQQNPRVQQASTSKLYDDSKSNIPQVFN